MNLKSLVVKRVDKDLPLPKYATEGSVGLDLVARETVTFEPFSVKKVPLNIIIKTPNRYATLLLPRSSLYMKKELLLVNSVGVIDRDYCGSEDEISAVLLYEPAMNINTYNNPYIKNTTIERGERICQLLLTRVDNNFKIIEVDEITTPSRRGYGSTGGYVDDSVE